MKLSDDLPRINGKASPYWEATSCLGKK